MVKIRVLTDEQRKESHRVASKKYYRLNREKSVLYASSEANIKYKSTPRYRIRRLATAAITRAKLLNIECDGEFLLSLADNPIKQVCSCCDSELRFEHKAPRISTPSFDRVDNSKGYVKGNVAITCGKCNRMKSDITPEFLRKLSAYFSRYLPSTCGEEGYCEDYLSL